MATAWRLAPSTFARALDGAGNRKFGARWNSAGQGVVYASENLSLCVLETYVHFAAGQRNLIPDFVAVRLHVPDDASTRQVSEAEFGRLLREAAPEQAFRRTGDAWLAQAEHLVLRAPSIVVPEERNVLINPAHPRMHEVRIVSERPFRFDARLSLGG